MPRADIQSLVARPPREKVVPVFSDYVAVNKYQRLSNELSNTPEILPRYKKLLSELKQAEQEIEDATLELTFHSISRKDLRFLLDYHQPTEEQKKENPDMLYNPDTFPAALIAACCVDPIMTYEDAQAIFDNWSEAEAMSLFDAAWQLCFIKTTPNYHASIDRDPQLKIEMRLCNQMGIPHSIFTGRAWPRPGEPMWLDDDQDKAIAFMLLEAEICQGCGWAERQWKDDDEVFIADAKRCKPCEAREMLHAEIPSDQKGIKVFVRATTEEDFDPELVKERFRVPDPEKILDGDVLG